MTHAWHRWFGFALLLLLTACAVQPPQAQLLPPLPVSPEPSLPPSASPTNSSTEVAPTATWTPEPAHTPTPAFQLCSPLGIHPLEELPLIVGDPYNPPPPGREERHHGVDFGYYHYKNRDSMLGEPVQSVLPGVVASVLDNLYPYGNMVMIETPRSALSPVLVELLEIPAGESLYLLYAHLNLPPLVDLGEAVEACRPLGEVGMSGNTDIPHLHLETRLGPSGSVFESMRFYDTRATLEEMDNYVLWRTSGVFRHFDPLLLFNGMLEVFSGAGP